MLKVGFAKELVTPARGVPLVGYFNPRPNNGALDELYVKALLFEQDQTTTGLVVFDLCFVTDEMVERITEELRAGGLEFGGNLVFGATHTHTGPYVCDFFGVSADSGYVSFIEQRAVGAIQRAHANMAEAELFAGKVDDNPYAFNRRFWMKNGTVVTNPGKLNPDIERPEGPVDDEISILAVKQQGRITAIAANIVNHTDTVGGNLVSADWPGRMERELQNSLGYDLPVLTLLGCSGNINHFDVASSAPQAGYDEACRIGSGYGQIIAAQLDRLQKLDFSSITVEATDFTIPFRTISASEIKQAHEVLEQCGDSSSDTDMTSEGLAKGEGPVARFFAEQLLAFAGKCSGRERTFKLVVIKFGKQALFASIPGEAFTEIGLALKETSPYAHNFIVELAMGECGYIPLPECFTRGGYEILPVEGGGPREDTAPRIIDALKKMMS